MGGAAAPAAMHDGATVLAEAPLISGLRVLTLIQAGLGPDGVLALSCSTHLDRLEGVRSLVH